MSSLFVYVRDSPSDVHYTFVFWGAWQRGKQDKRGIESLGKEAFRSRAHLEIYDEQISRLFFFSASAR